MIDDTTRRRVLRGAGVIGVTGIVGTSLATAQEESPTPTAGEAALRVTHASPDAPAVSVRLDDQTVVEGLEFGTVTDYQIVDPGTYQLQIVAGGDGGGLLGGLFGSNQDETVLYDESVTVEPGTTYTAVAYGEAGEAAAGTPTEQTPTPDGGTTETAPASVQALQMGGGQGQGGGQAGPLVEDLGFGESASATVPEGEYRLLVRPVDEEEAEDGATPTDGEVMTPAPEDGATPTPESGTGFQVELLEDDLSSPPEGESRVRVFHAVPDVGPVNVIATPQGGQGQGQGQGGGQGQGEGPGGGQGQDPDDGPGGNQAGGQGPGGSQGQGPPLSADVTLEAGTVYSTFAVGYANPDAAGEETPTEASPAGTPAAESTAGTPTDGERPAFELLVAETATDGERVQGGGT